LNSPIDTIITAETPEGIAISIRPAGFAVRATAFLIDALIRFGLLLICGTVLGAAGHFGGGLLFIALFILNWLYPVLFELTAAAATPGKRIMGLLVVMTSGLPITPAGCLIRNLLRFVDLLPMLYAFAVVSILLRHDSRRLGDLAAGTVVAYRHDVQSTGALAEGEPIAPPMPLSARQQMAITAFAWRVGRLTPQRAEELAALAAAAAPGGNAALTGVAEARPGIRSAAGTSLTARLIGVARWLHGERSSTAQPTP
jgi:uncharacterized RDD family membrane protein YckC